MDRIWKASAATAVAAILTVSLTLQMQASSRRERTEKPAYAVAIEAELPDGTRLEAEQANGTVEASAAVWNGKCSLQLTPGSYTLCGGGLRLGFVLQENAAVGAGSGDGWTDGEVVHLSPMCGYNVVLYRTNGHGSYRYTLSGEAGDYAAVLDHSYGEPGWRSTQIAGVPAGEYQLYENGTLLRSVKVDGHASICVGGE